VAKLPSFKRILTDQLQKYEDLQEPVFSVLNSFMESVTRALNGKLTFSENLDAQVITFTDTGAYPVKLAWDKTSRPKAVWIGAISRVDGADVVLPAAVSVNWKFNQSGQIEILDMTGLAASTTDKYLITLLAITG